MINLYRLLGLTAYACDDEIRQALAQHSHTLEPKVIRAVHAWLLDPNVRQEYDQKLHAHEPQMFVISQADFNPYTPPNSYEPTSELDTPRPALWHPNRATFFALVAVPVAAWLHAKNWQALGNDKLARANQIFAIIMTVFALLFAFAETWTGVETTYGGVGVLGMILWYVTLGKQQITFVKDELDDDYERKGWIKPIIATVLYVLALIVVITIIATFFIPSN